ncbi:MAG: hypothetical protein LUG89_05010 [Methanosphaera sp.]|nr:hypothetical protein [Methanosphaera sp.]
MKKEYIQTNDLIDTYNVAYPKAAGNGKYGEKTAKSEIMKPGQITTKTFINFGTFNTHYEAVALQKYMKTKLLRTLLGTKKITQDNLQDTWSNIPLQDFTENSDINWDVSIKEIDEQLYEKYDLSTTEIEFIETHVEEMK